MSGGGLVVFKELGPTGRAGLGEMKTNWLSLVKLESPVGGFVSAMAFVS